MGESWHSINVKLVPGDWAALNQLVRVRSVRRGRRVTVAGLVRAMVKRYLKRHQEEVAQALAAAQPKAGGRAVTRLKPLPGLRGRYLVGDDGSVWKKVRGGYRRLRGYSEPGRYVRVQVIGPDGRRRKRYVHELVLTTFVGPRPPGQQCRHLDGNGHSNNIDNLVWGTPAANGLDRKRHGRTLAGERHPLAKLTGEDVGLIRLFAGAGMKTRELARQFGVSVSTIQGILRGKSWLVAA
jgi:hypothetical protein